LLYFFFRLFSYTLFLIANLAATYLAVEHIFGLEQQSFERYLWQIPVYLAMYFLFRLFTFRTVTSQEFVETLKANIMALLVIVLVFFVSKSSEEYSRKVVLLYFFANTLIPVYMYVLKRYAMQLKVLREPVFAICDRDGRRNIENWFVKDNAFGFDVAGIEEINGSLSVMAEEIVEKLKQQRYYALVIAASTQRATRMFYLIDRLQPFISRIIIVPSLARMPIINVQIISSINNKGLAMFVKNNLLNPTHRILKGISDRVLALLFSIFFLPVLVLLYVVVSIDTGFSPIFVQERIGYGGRRFRMYKFRTMRKDAQEKLKELLQHDENLKKEWESSFKLKEDPRVTRVGAFLRKTSLDELPQLINVLKGDMSLVGPRPIVEEEKSRYGEYFEYYKRVKPGITGLWQVSGRNDVSYSERVQMDVWYVRNWSLELDWVILLKTVGSVLSGKGSY